MLSTNSNDIAFGVPLVSAVYSSARYETLGSALFVQHIYMLSAVQTCVFLPLMLACLEAGKAMSLAEKEDGEDSKMVEADAEAPAVDGSKPRRQGTRRVRMGWCSLLGGVCKRLLVQPVVVAIFLGLACNLVFSVWLQRDLPGLLSDVTQVAANAFLLLSLLQAGMALVGRLKVLTQEKGVSWGEGGGGLKLNLGSL